ncbi:unnamed protein product [Brachionus calyciflorus]|uniref:Neurotransmitter-gated ion-channel ligand-binding domain-containing protein n=1 Tax=Brachionus calyciflorus TaxID=104777 RepID=A0A814LSV9_9BILA|nr:unnamed protein product [Brachionus calyciflorus]
MEYFSNTKENEQSTDVYIRVSFTKIHEIDTLNQRFHAELLIESKWFDQSVKTINHDLKSLEWKPEIYIENALNEPKEEITYRIIQSENLMVCEIRKIKGVFWENLELENFPLDIQNLSIIILTKKSGKKVNFILMQDELSKIKISNNLDKSSWYLHEMVKVNREEVTREYSFGQRIYPGIRITCQAFRLPGYFYWNVLLPIFLITFASLGPFVIDCKSAFTRLPSTATMLLSSVSFKGVVGRLLPTVSYLTSLDKYSLASITLISLMFIYHSILAAFIPVLTESLSYYLDKMAFLGFFGLVVTMQLVYGLWIIKVNNFRNRLIEKSIFYEHQCEPSHKKNN